MKPIRLWNAPIGLPHLLVLGCSLMGCMSFWIGYVIPYLSSLLASKKRFAEHHPFLYDPDTAVVITLLPLIVVVTFVVVYLFQRSYDREQQRHTARPA
jgi:hypothetical protein